MESEDAAAQVSSMVNGLYVGMLLVPSAASRSSFHESGGTAKEGRVGTDKSSPPTVQLRCLRLRPSTGREDALPKTVAVEASGEVYTSKAAGEGAVQRLKSSSLEEQKDWQDKEKRSQLQQRKELTGRREPSSMEEDEKEERPGEAGANGKKRSHVKAETVRHFKGDVVEEGTEYLFRTHMCPECKRCFKKRTHLVEHLHLHFPDPNLQCPNCDKFFTSRSKLKIHMMREVGEKSHRCPLCDYSSVEKNALNRHMASMHDNISNFYSDVYSCPVCEQKFQLSQALKDHLKTHKIQQKILRCFQDGCSCSTEDRKEFICHLKEAHGTKAVECRYHACSLLFPTRDEMEAHRKSHYAFHCEQCDFVCSNKHAYHQHKRRGHAGSEKLQCNFCPYTTYNPVEFSDHVGKMHANEKIHKCTECDFATAHKRVILRHMLLHTGEKPHKCNVCDFTCRDMSYLSKHMLTHSSTKDYMCTECGYITKWKHYLSVHMRKHAGDLRYQCNQCSYRCHRADQLSSHKLRHQGKSLICEVCGFACKRKYELQKHTQVKHSQNYQVPIFQCQYCSYQTKYKQALFNHENCKHTKQKLFRCALCVYHTFSNTSLFFHKRKAHGYVPGDKDWLENYASKQMEVSSANLLLCYDLKAARRSNSNPLTKRGLWQKDDPSAVDTQETCQEVTEVPVFVVADPQPEQDKEIAGTEETGKPGRLSNSTSPVDACVETPSAGSTDIPKSTLNSVDTCHMPVNSPLSFEQLSKDFLPVRLENVGRLMCGEGGTSFKKLASREGLALEGNGNPEDDHLDFEDENDLQEVELSRPENSIVCSEETNSGPSKESIQCDSRSICEEQSPQGTTFSNSKTLIEDGHIQSQETCSSLLIIDSSECELNALERTSFLEVSAGDVSSEMVEQSTQSESMLRALRKQDREQAETLVLEGRVQMLVVKSETQIFKCEKCSYITWKKKSMCLHSKAGCPSRKSPLMCKECGASFKQQRGLNTHLAKKCPVVLKRNRMSLKPPSSVESGTCRQARKMLSNANVAVDGYSCTKDPVLNVQSSWELKTGGKDRERLAVAAKVVPSIPQRAIAKPCERQCSSETLVEHLVAEGVARVQCRLENGNSQKSKQYRFEQGKFYCSSCSFVCSRATNIRSHVGEGCRKLDQFSCSLCSVTFRSSRMLKKHQGEKHTSLESTDSTAEERSKEGPDKDPVGISKEESESTLDQGNQMSISNKPDSPKARLSCSFCPFTCRQPQSMQAHCKEGCVKATEFQCLLCSFVCQSAKALKHHQKLHKKYTSKRPQLQCRQCDFTCKQSRCLKQHIRIRHEGMKPHKCHFCDFSTTRRYRVEAHESLHTGVGRIACNVCSQTFGTNSKLRIHKLRVHEKKPTHFCSLCDYSGYNQNDITRHTNSCHNGELNFSCSQCQARFSSETALKQHTLRKHEEKVRFSCPRCVFVCHSEATLKCHVQKQHPHLECSACRETFSSREDLEKHKKGHLNYHCQCCTFASKERQQLIQHYIEEHEAGQERPFKCSFCSFTCCHQVVLDYHMKGHGGTRIYKCSDCEYATKNKQKITWHIRIHTGEKPYKCHLCKYACVDPSRLKYHMRIHKDERKYVCPDCGYKCKWVNQLKYHQSKHTGIKPYQCDECEYCTNRADALRIHKETRHQDARTFICEQCGKAFKTRFLLKTHLKKHSADKPYVCNVCLRDFRWAAGLRHHFLTHTNEHPFFCRFCTYKAKQKFQVIKHIQRHHPERAAEDPSQGVGKDPSTSTIHLHDVQLDRLHKASAGANGGSGASVAQSTLRGCPDDKPCPAYDSTQSC